MILLKKRESCGAITLDHGSGGKASRELVNELFKGAFDNPPLALMEDSAKLTVNGSRLALTTDSYVVDPIFFPGGNIGELAIFGTVNDLAMVGAQPLYLTAGFILEEGFPLADLAKVVQSMREASQKAGVMIVAGDTKVVPAGKADKIFINTSGLGIIKSDLNISPTCILPGDAVIVSGTMADHGITILCAQEGLHIEGDFRSDTAPLNHLVLKIIDRFGSQVHALRDPTRGGVATALNEMAGVAGVSVWIEEEKLPVRPAVQGACELLGMEPLYLANEGKFLVITAPQAAAGILELMRADPLGADAQCIGVVKEGHPGKVIIQTPYGTERIVPSLHGIPLPRIC